MKVLIIEDELIAANRLRTQLLELRPDYFILKIIDSVEDSIHWFQTNPHPDVVFLDIQLSDGISFEIFEKVKTDSLIIFTTAFDEYAIRAFELHAVDYLLKPISIEKLSQAIDKLEKHQNAFNSGSHISQLNSLLQTFKNKDRTPYRIRFLINKNDGYVPVLAEDIAYFYTQNDNLYLITKKGDSHVLNFTLEALQEELDPLRFWRANRSYLVSSDCIVKAHNYFNYRIKLEIHPKPSEDVIISRQRVNNFKKWFNR
ncbi:MAG: response regulator transcription factor [Bacteroidales bacterium]|nr:response regulator transcription factor [Bacteroidales bacterium]